MKTLIATADRHVSLIDVELPRIPVGGAILEVLACGICGSDAEKLAYREHPEQCTLGHEVVGILHSICPTYRGRFRARDRVVVAHHVPCEDCQYCRTDSESMCETFKSSNLQPGGFSEMVVLTEGHLNKTTFLIPKSVGDDVATCVEPLACVLKAIRRGGHVYSSKTLIVGLGFIGLMAGQLFSKRGDRVFSVDINIERLKFAQHFNLHRLAFLPEQFPPEQRMDLVFLSVVNQATVDFALAKVRDGGTIVLFAASNQPVTIDASVLYFREILIVPSYSPGLKDLAEATRFIFQEEITLKPLLTHRYPLQHAQQAFDMARSPDALKVVVYPKGFDPL